MFSAFKNRRPWAAALLNLILGPFIGMLYLCRGRTAILYFLVGLCLAAVGLAFLPQIVASPDEPILGWILGLPLGIVGAVHAVRIARHWDITQPLRWYAHWYSLAAFVVIFPLFALGIRTFLYQPFNTASASMSPTLNVGDYFFASKFAYRDSSPQRGDLVVFHTQIFGGANYIKRIVGVPGDHIQMRNDRLYINGVVVPQRRISDFLQGCDSGPCRVSQYEETLPGGRTDRVLDWTVNGPFDNTQEFVVPPNSYFVLGDNRDNSDDSRADVGFVSRTDIIGRVAYKYIEGGHWVWKPVN